MSTELNYMKERRNKKTLTKLEGAQSILSRLFFTFASFPGGIFVSIYFIVVLVLGHFASIDEIMFMIISTMENSDHGTGGLADFADIAGSRFSIVYFASVVMAVLYQVGREAIRYFFD